MASSPAAAAASAGTGSMTSAARAERSATDLLQGYDPCKAAILLARLACREFGATHWCDTEHSSKRPACICQNGECASNMINQQSQTYRQYAKGGNDASTMAELKERAKCDCLDADPPRTVAAEIPRGVDCKHLFRAELEHVVVMEAVMQEGYVRERQLIALLGGRGYARTEAKGKKLEDCVVRLLGRLEREHMVVHRKENGGKMNEWGDEDCWYVDYRRLMQAVQYKILKMKNPDAQKKKAEAGEAEDDWACMCGKNKWSAMEYFKKEKAGGRYKDEVEHEWTEQCDGSLKNARDRNVDANATKRRQTINLYMAPFEECIGKIVVSDDVELQRMKVDELRKIGVGRDPVGFKNLKPSESEQRVGVKAANESDRLDLSREFDVRAGGCSCSRPFRSCGCREEPQVGAKRKPTRRELEDAASRIFKRAK